MELRDYLKILGNSWLTIALITLAAAGLAAAWSKAQPSKYESSVTMVVNKPNTIPQRSVEYFQYDKYYSIQASSLFADTLTAWLSSPSTAQEIYVKAGLPVPDVNLKKLSRIFKPSRMQPATISLTVREDEKVEAEKLINAAVAVMQDKTTQQHEGDDPDHYFSLISGAVATAELKQDTLLNVAIGLLSGLVLSLILVFMRDYLRRS
jgi:capsular polysaccharide biosynthesis protein